MIFFEFVSFVRQAWFSPWFLGLSGIFVQTSCLFMIAVCGVRAGIPPYPLTDLTVTTHDQETFTKQELQTELYVLNEPLAMGKIPKPY
jgi:hypothetical protein